jgi:MOSC domain-containing protein YiiM
MPRSTESAATARPRPELKILLQSIQVGLPQSIDTAHGPIRTALIKRPVAGALHLGLRALAEDGCADLVHHGLIDQAICVFPAQHRRTLAEELQLGDREAGDFGENFTIEGFDEQQIQLGDQFEIGQALVEVSKARAPCRTLNQVWNCSQLAAVMGRRGLTGWYCRVLRVGLAAAGQTMVLVHREADAPTVRQQWLARQARKSSGKG